ncbi:hypothetical protein [Rhodococcus opacus]|uniref:hypothetical protein n=1 Tax=Rhodococcus opacus TaxID=37919 RepID=UPI00046CA41D|nr:hypothetical protein [Rhodococcus opacus]UDH01765.1 hypothetical protein K2Z90_008225 [Rhodococcus opacus PD630]
MIQHDTLSRNDDDSFYVATLSWRTPIGTDPEHQVSIVRTNLEITAAAVVSEIDTITTEPAADLRLTICGATSGVFNTLFTASGATEQITEELAEYSRKRTAHPTDSQPTETRSAPWKAAARPLTAPTSNPPRTTHRGAQQ